MTEVPKINADGVYDIDIEEYHSDCCAGPSTSSSGIRTILENPQEYWWESYLNPDRKVPVKTKPMMLGSAAHILLLDEEGFAERYVLRPAELSGYKWNANRTEHKAWMSAQEKLGKIVITKEDIDTIQYMRDSLARHDLVKEGLINGDIEKSLIWKDEESGIWMKSRPDAVPFSSNIIVDLKTCAGTGLRAGQRSIENFGYDIQLGIAGWAMEAVLDRVVEKYVIAWVSTNPPYDAMVNPIHDEYPYWGRRKAMRGLEIMKECLDTGVWPGNRGDGETIGPTTYYQFEHKEMDERRELPLIHKGLGGKR